MEEIIELINFLIDEEVCGRRVEKMIVCNSPAVQNESQNFIKFSHWSLIYLTKNLSSFPDFSFFLFLYTRPFIFLPLFKVLPLQDGGVISWRRRRRSKRRSNEWNSLHCLRMEIIPLNSHHSILEIHFAGWGFSLVRLTQ